MQATDAKADLEWQGMQMFVENGVAESDPRMDEVYQHFDANLRDIVDVLSDKGMHVILSTVPVNLATGAVFIIESESLAAEQRSRCRSLEKGDGTI